MSIAPCSSRLSFLYPFAIAVLALVACLPPGTSTPSGFSPPAPGGGGAAPSGADDGDDGDDDDEDDGDDDVIADDGDEDGGDARNTAPPRDRTTTSRRGQWSCNAEGSYQTCNGSGLCTTWPVTGMGLGTSESQARVQAETNCSGHMSNLMATANMGDSSASVRSSCAVTTCSP